MVDAPKSHVIWEHTHRLILSHYPPIDLFDDIADPQDWELLAQAEARTNPRIYEEIGDLSLVPANRRVAGEGASWVMAAFTHISPDRTSRFSDGSFGIYYAGDSLETALREHCFHMGRFYENSNSVPGWLSEVRQLVGSIDHELTDIRGEGFDELLHKEVEKYAPSQQFAIAEKAKGSDGIVYPSQRHEEGECIAAFYPDVVGIPSQGDHFRYHWNGTEIDYVQMKSGDQLMYKMD